MRPHRLGCPVPGILQARTLEWVASSFSNAWKPEQNNTVSSNWFFLPLHGAGVALSFFLSFPFFITSSRSFFITSSLSSGLNVKRHLLFLPSDTGWHWRVCTLFGPLWFSGWFGDFRVTCLRSPCTSWSVGLVFQEPTLIWNSVPYELIVICFWVG